MSAPKGHPSVFAIRLGAEPTDATHVLPAAGPADDAEIAALLRVADDPNRAGAVQTLPRPCVPPPRS
jgi:hypothetical protein